MLELIESKLHEVVVESATNFIMKNDRERFDSVFTIIESFTINNNGIIGGNNGINMLAGVPKSKDSYMYDIYIADADKNARELADLLYNSNHRYVDKNTIRLETKLRNKIYELWIEARMIARIYALVDYRDIKLFLLLNPVRTYGYFPMQFSDAMPASHHKQKIFAMSSEIQLLDIYRRLYNPYPSARGGISYETYDTLLDNEQKLYGVISEYIIDRARGTEQNIMSITRAEGGHQQGAHRQIIPIISRQLIKELTSANENTAVVGDYSIKQMLPNYPKTDRLQLLTSEPLSNIKSMLEGIVSSNKDIKRIMHGSDDVKIVYIRYPLNLPNDIMIEKASFYIQSDPQIFICDVFNSPTYEMIPFKQYSNDVAKYANIVACLRFKFIDLYVSRIINNLREGKDTAVLKNISQIASAIKLLRERLALLCENDLSDVFSTNSDSYIGVFVMPNALLKGKIADLLKGKKYHFNYFPAKK